MKRGYLLILGAIVLFSTIEVVAKYLQMGAGAAGQVGPLQVATLRFLFGAAFILVLLLGRRQGKLVPDSTLRFEDIELNRGYGAVVRSVWTAPVCLWRR